MKWINKKILLCILFKETFNILCKVKKFGLNVGTDCFNYTPSTIEEILFYKQAIEKYYDQDVFI